MKAILFLMFFFLTSFLISSCSKNHSSNHPAQNQNLCDTPINARCTNLWQNQAFLQWKDVNGAISYEVMYRQVGTMTWDSIISHDSLFLYPLALRTAYEWKVQTICASGASGYTSSKFFRTFGDTLYATYNGGIHFFTVWGFTGNSTSGTQLQTNNDSLGHGINLTQSGAINATASFACNPSLTNNSLNIDIGNVYQNTINSHGSETRTFINNYTVTVTFSGTFYNIFNASDSIVITNGSYTGGFLNN